VQVAYGPQRLTLPLLPAPQRPGEYHAVLVPTQAGIYAFHVSGAIQGRPIDVSATCSGRTFDCVLPVTDIQFPTSAAPASELEQGLARALQRVQRASDSAATARTLAIVAIVIAGVVVLAAGVGFAATRSRRR
jgi:hypothetical protein